MYRRLALLVMFVMSIHVYGKHKSAVTVNYGVKTGFSSTIYDVRDLAVFNYPITTYTSHSEISSFHTAFVRMNIHRHYVQTECSYNISKYSISFPIHQWAPMYTGSEQSSISTKNNGIEIPFYYGYHIMKDASYGMSFYMGPKAKFVLTNISSHVFDKLPFADVTETIHPINFSMMIGLGVSISPVFFDFSFEYGLHNISDHFITTNSRGEEYPNGLTFDRRKNVLSFSIGFMF